MTLLDRLQAHRGSLIRIKSQLYWYDGRGWDGVPGRLCILLDAAVDPPVAANFALVAAAATVGARAAALLLVDGAPRWVWVVAKDIELLDGGDR